MAVTIHTIVKMLSASICAASIGLLASPASANHCPNLKGFKHHYAPSGMYHGYGSKRGRGYKHGCGMNPYMMGYKSMYDYHMGMHGGGKSGYYKKGKEAYGEKKDLVDTAIAVGNFNTLVKALGVAGLENLLKGKGPYTVFAPTDEAFAKLPEGKLDELLADKEKLAAVLKYHVVPGKMSAADVLQAREFKTAEGQTLSVQQLDVAKADIETKNGIIHVIDSVLVPTL